MPTLGSRGQLFSWQKSNVNLLSAAATAAHVTKRFQTRKFGQRAFYLKILTVGHEHTRERIMTEKLILTNTFFLYFLSLMKFSLMFKNATVEIWKHVGLKIKSFKTLFWTFKGSNIRMKLFILDMSIFWNDPRVDLKWKFECRDLIFLNFDANLDFGVGRALT